MNLYLIRHGESVGNTKRGFLSGRSDPEGLTTTGRAQVIRRAWDLRDVGIEVVVTSPVVRAAESADIIGRLLHIPVYSLPAFSELDHGEFEGYYWWEMKERFADMKTGPWEDYETPYPGGESFKDLSQRVETGIEKLMTQPKDVRATAIVAHDAVVATLVYLFQHGLGISDPKDYRKFLQGFSSANAGCWRISSDNGGYRVYERSNALPVGISNELVSFYSRGMERLPEDSEVTPVSTVSKNENFTIRSGKKTYLIKILHDQERLSGQRLIDLYEYLELHTSIQAPNILRYDHSGAFFNSDVLIQDYHEGFTLNDCLKDHPFTAIHALSQVYRQLTRIHRIPVEDVYSFWYPEDWNRHAHPTWDRYIVYEIGKTLQQIKSSPLSREAMILVTEHLSRLEQYVKLKQYKTVPLHGDPLPSNFIITHKKGECRLARTIDFERARIGDPLWDFVYVYGFLERKNDPAASFWKEMLFKKLSVQQQTVFSWYRTLFHAWTVRDMMDYQGVEKRNSRGEKSLEILKKNGM